MGAASSNSLLHPARLGGRVTRRDKRFPNRLNESSNLLFPGTVVNKSDRTRQMGLANSDSQKNAVSS
jgi:hypothetical protein